MFMFSDIYIVKVLIVVIVVIILMIVLIFVVLERKDNIVSVIISIEDI
jgi:hypothetical protein